MRPNYSEPPRYLQRYTKSSSKRNRKNIMRSNSRTRFRHRVLLVITASAILTLVLYDSLLWKSARHLNDNSDVREEVILADNNTFEGIPSAIESSYRNLTAPLVETDLPVFWHVPKSGGTVVQDILAQCLSFPVASEVGGVNHTQDTSLQIVEVDELKFANVDTTTTAGLNKARELGLAQSGLVRAAFTSFLHEAAPLFDDSHKGRIFALFRHPVHRAVSMYYYLQVAKWEETYDPELAVTTIEQYANSTKVERDWMTRMLTFKYTEELTENDLKVAKEILRTKCLVGLLSDMKASTNRFFHYFGWNAEAEEHKECINRYTTHGNNVNPHPRLEEGTEAWNALLDANRFDMQLYEYAVKLFEEQSVMFALKILPKN